MSAFPLPIWGGPMRTITKLLVPAMAAGLLAATLPAGAATAAPVVQPELFGQHVAKISSGAPESLRGAVGAIRLWDAGLTWRELQPTRNGPIDIARLQTAVNNASALGASEIMFTLGSTPEWAANSTALQPANARLALYGPGSNSHPDEAAFLAFLKAIASPQNVQGITSFQMWNEANLKDFYLGTPTQMAQLTKRAKQALREVGSGAKLVAASTTVRADWPCRQVRQGLRGSHAQGQGLGLGGRGLRALLPAGDVGTGHAGGLHQEGQVVLQEVRRR